MPPGRRGQSRVLLRGLRKIGIVPGGNSALPLDAAAGAVAAEVEERGELVAIEGDDRVAEALAGVEVAVLGQRVVDSRGPALFLEGREDEFLVAGGVFVAADERAIEVQFVEVGAPLRARDCGLGTGD